MSQNFSKSVKIDQNLPKFDNTQQKIFQNESKIGQNCSIVLEIQRSKIKTSQNFSKLPKIN